MCDRIQRPDTRLHPTATPKYRVNPCNAGAIHTSHSVGYDECFDQTTGICCGVGFPELDDRFNWLELNEV